MEKLGLTSRSDLVRGSRSKPGSSPPESRHSRSGVHRTTALLLLLGVVARARTSPDAGRPAKIDLELRPPPLTADAPRPSPWRDPQAATEHERIVPGDEISAPSRVRRRLPLTSGTWPLTPASLPMASSRSAEPCSPFTRAADTRAPGARPDDERGLRRRGRRPGPQLRRRDRRIPSPAPQGSDARREVGVSDRHLRSPDEDGLRGARGAPAGRPRPTARDVGLNELWRDPRLTSARTPDNPAGDLGLLGQRERGRAGDRAGLRPAPFAAREVCRLSLTITGISRQRRTRAEEAEPGAADDDAGRSPHDPPCGGVPAAQAFPRRQQDCLPLEHRQSRIPPQLVQTRGQSGEGGLPDLLARREGHLHPKIEGAGQKS